MKGFGSIFAAILGIFLFLGSFGLLWWNEGNSALKISIANYADKHAIQSYADNIDKNNDNKLIAVSAPAITNDTLTDNIVTLPKTIVLDREVLMYQWSEDIKDGQNVYNKVWSDYYIDSENFENKQYKNPKFPIKSDVYYAKNVKLGSFQLIKEQIEAIEPENDFRDLPNNNNYKINNGTYFSGNDINNPEIGDIMISYTYSPTNTDISIIGQQNSDNTISSLPFKKSGIYIQYNGKMTKDEIIETYRKENSVFTMFIRLGGWLLMLIGLKLIISPIITILNLVPIVGKLADMLTLFILALISLALSLITIAIAWIAYRPLISISLLGISVLSIVIANKLVNKNMSEQI